MITVVDANFFLFDFFTRIFLRVLVIPVSLTDAVGRDWLALQRQFMVPASVEYLVSEMPCNDERERGEYAVCSFFFFLFLLLFVFFPRFIFVFIPWWAGSHADSSVFPGVADAMAILGIFCRSAFTRS